MSTNEKALSELKTDWEASLDWQEGMGYGTSETDAYVAALEGQLAEAIQHRNAFKKVLSEVSQERESLRADNARLAARLDALTTWRSASERPEKWGEYLCVMLNLRGEYVYLVRWYGCDGWSMNHFDFLGWMPIPDFKEGDRE